MGKTIVIGGGVIGLLSAYELRRRGREVVVLDKGEMRRGSSSGNAGWITPSLSAPVPAPGLVANSLRWMLKPKSPLHIRPAAVPQIAGWLFSFWRHCNVGSYERGLSALSKFNETTIADYDALVAGGLRFEMHDVGLMYVFLTEKALRATERELETTSKFAPIDAVKMDAAEALSYEPALRPDIFAAIYIRSDRHVRPESLLAGAYEWLQQNGVELRSHTAVLDFAMEGGRVRGVRTAEGVIDAAEVLIATGAESGLLARRLGLHLPMQAGKGYSMTMEMETPPVRRNLMLAEARVGIAPYKGAVRIAGTMELSGINTTMRQERVDALLDNARRYIGGLGAAPVVERWVGMRPMLPDGLPAIGRVRGIDNVYIASGHVMLGVTLGPTTATAIAELMVTGRAKNDLVPFDPNRFDRGPARSTVSG